MKRFLLLALALCGAIYCAGCQITVEDLTPFELRKGGGESVEPKPPEPKPPEPKPPAAGKDVVYMLGINGID